MTNDLKRGARLWGDSRFSSHVSDLGFCASERRTALCAIEKLPAAGVRGLLEPVDWELAVCYKLLHASKTTGKPQLKMNPSRKSSSTCPSSFFRVMCVYIVVTWDKCQGSRLWTGI